VECRRHPLISNGWYAVKPGVELRTVLNLLSSGRWPRRRGLGRLSTPVLAALVAGCTPPPPAAFAPLPAGGEGGVVAVSEPLAAAAGARILAVGGNAIDAAIAIQAMLTVTEPQSSGIGGGGFALVHQAGRGTLPAETVVLDFRETAPADLPPVATAGADFAIASTTGAAVGVPATVKAMARASARWGTIPLAAALAPAIAAAEEGVIVSPRFAAAIARALTPAAGEDGSGGGRLAMQPGDPAWDAARSIFAPGGRPVAAGDRLRQPDLARTLRLIATAGEAAFYDCRHPGGIALAIVRAQQATRLDAAGRPDPAGEGRMRCADLAAYDVVLRPPVEGRYRGLRIVSVPPPSSGGVALLQMLAMLERFPLGQATDPGGGDWGPGGVATLNVLQDAMRLAFADRARWLGDPAFFPVPVAGLLAPAYLSRRAASCDAPDPAAAAWCLAPGKRLAAVAAGEPAVAGDTTHFTVADRFGNVVAWTGTIETTWGSGLMVPGYGFLLNNQLTDFNRPPRRSAEDPGANDPAPGKRPRSSITPTMVFDPASGAPIAALGSPGGATIPNTVLGVLLGLLAHRLPLDAAIDAPRLSLTSPADGTATLVEAGFDAGVLARLEATCTTPDTPAACYRFRQADAIGSVQAILIDPATGRRQGGADRRRDGTVIALPAAALPATAR
jgi:gamma-glutamyltranspeptidase/glutathione hydrolase